MNLWLVPQISEHWPKYSPGRFIKKLVWFSRPGVASVLTPNAGMVHEWITSMAVTSTRICEWNGRTTRLSTSSSRNPFIGRSFGLIIYESNSSFLKSEYSYFQYHWWPIDFKVSEGLQISSRRYRSRREGRAINTRVTAGIMVQIISINCPSRRNRLIYLLKNSVNIKYPTRIVIIVKIIRVWSWKKDSCSISGEAPSWRLKLDQVAMF